MKAPIQEVVQRPGVQTSEFKMSLAMLIVGALLLVVGIYLKNETAMVIGGGMLAAVAPSYNVSRGMTKMRQPHLFRMPGKESK